MTESQQDPVSESQIAVHWREEEYIYPPESFPAGQCGRPGHFRPVRREELPGLFHRIRGDAELGQEVDTVLDASNAPFWKWFTGGRLNASYNCVDRHLAEHGDKAAIIWVPDRRPSSRSPSPTGSSTTR